MANISVINLRIVFTLCNKMLFDILTIKTIHHIVDVRYFLNNRTSTTYQH